MIRQLTIKVNAAYPEVPLETVAFFAGSAATLSISGVPGAVGKRKITGIAVRYTNAGGAASSVDAVKVGSVYEATIPSQSTPYSATLGIKVIASGKDENDAAVSWTLGAADLLVLNSQGQVTPGGEPGEPAAYLKSVTVANNKATFTKKDDTTVEVTASSLGALTEHQDISGKQDVISDLATIRSGSALGATALQDASAFDAAGTAAAAVTAHEEDEDAHEALFNAKLDKTGGTIYGNLTIEGESGTVSSLTLNGVANITIGDSGDGYLTVGGNTAGGLWVGGVKLYSVDYGAEEAPSGLIVDKADKATTLAGYGITDGVKSASAGGATATSLENNNLDVSPLFATGNTSLMNVVRYGTGSSPADRKVVTIVVDAQTSAITLPTPTANVVTDLVVILDCRNVATIPAGLPFGGTILWAGGTAIAPVAGKVMVYGLTCDGTTKVNNNLAYVGNGISCG